MGYTCKVIEDSVSMLSGARLTTMEVTFPRIVLAEFNTHRVFSRNSASSRAIPIAKMLDRVRVDPFIPIYWGKNQRGMQAAEELDYERQALAEVEWLTARDNAVVQVMRLSDIGIHKQIANRLLEPWLWHTVIVTATEWENFFNLRCHPAAQPEIRRVAEMMRDAYSSHVPRRCGDGEWHLPYVDIEDGRAFGVDDVPWVDTVAQLDMILTALENHKVRKIDVLVKISCARCARVSYLTHDGRRSVEEDLALYEKLAASGHMSPLEHAARPMTVEELLEGRDELRGNFRGWVSHRKQIPREAIFNSASS